MIRVSLNADQIWPLLSDQYAESERVASRVMVANILLHELAVCTIRL